jgi:tRNA(His) guanylyltransferase
MKLADRMETYREAAETKLLPRLPLIMEINGRSFSKQSNLLDKPYDQKLGECLMSCMLKLCQEVEGTLFGFQHNDEIVLVARNDQTPETTPWFNNSVSKICSVVSAMATLHFNRCLASVELNMMGEPLFTTQVFVVPNVAEATNALVYKQQHNFHTSIQFACFYELINRYDKEAIKQMVSGLSVDERVDLLQQECGIDFHQYPAEFRRGVACYKVPKLEEGKYKWTLNKDLPIFTRDQAFLSNIFKHGADIFRGE